MDNYSIFAMLYILAQGVERLVEPFTEINLWGNPDSTDPKVKRQRTLWLWVVSSVVGVLACFLFNVDFFSLIKGGYSPTVNIIFSGIIVGSGTKPVHDLITIIQRYATKS